MSVIVLGYTGMLGKYVAKYLEKNHEVFRIGRAELNASNPENMNRIFREFEKGDTVVNCMGIIKQKEHTVKDLISVNSLFPHTLQDFCHKYELHLIHITTDCVFSGKTGGYNEFDEHDTIDSYGKSKSFGEPSEACIIRTSIIGEDDGHSLLSWVVSNRGKSINGYTHHVWNGVTCLELSKIIGKIINEKSYWMGIRHIFTNESITKYKLCKLISDVYKLGITVNKLKTYSKRNMTLSTSFHESLVVHKGYRAQIEEQKIFKL